MKAMRSFLLPILTGVLAWVVVAGGTSSANTTSNWPVHDDGLTDLVQWDHYSFYAHGQRLFVFSGEFHYWRYPVPELWRDLLEKIKAAGFNAFSIYNHWYYHNPFPGTLDFTTGAHNFSSILSLSKELGLYMIVRPGPYINAEANAGGFPLWVTTGAYGGLRDNDPRYTEAWKPYMSAVAEVIRPHLITNGGNVILYQIENELGEQWLDVEDRVDNVPVQEYMEMLYENAREAGIEVPLMHNAPNMNGYSWSRDFSNATGNVDVVGLDSYPSCWSCNLSECTGTNGEYEAYKTQNYYDYFTVQSPTQPNFLPEFQGGSYNPWGGPEGGCPGDIGADFANMFYRNLIYQRVSAISLYMLFGGTNWGWHGAPVVATSYDYSSPISENRVIGDKYYETKLLAQFTRVAYDLAMTDRIGNSSSYTTNPSITASELRNPETNSAFYVVMHGDSTSPTTETFKLRVNTSSGELTIPRLNNSSSITISGHQAKILVTDFSYGGGGGQKNNKYLLYSTAEVLTYSSVAAAGEKEKKETIVLWVPTGEGVEFVVKGDGIESAELEGGDGSCKGCEDVRIIIDHDNENNDNDKTRGGGGGVLVSLKQNQGMTVFVLNDGSRVVVVDRSWAYRFWSPNNSPDPRAPPEETLLVQGPYLLRSAVLLDKNERKTIQLKGDAANDTEITIFAPESVDSVYWNDREIEILSSKDGMITAALKSSPSFELPLLGPWEVADSLPEIGEDYEPTSLAWIEATNLNTTNPTTPPPASNNPILYVDDYGIHVGHHIFRATFPSYSSSSSSPPPPTDLFLSLTGGLAFGFSAWVNSHFIGSWLGKSYLSSQNLTLSLANATLYSDDSEDSERKENVLVILMDNSGHDLRADALIPRGISNAILIGPAEEEYEFTGWKIAGTAGTGTGTGTTTAGGDDDGEQQQQLDPLRGPLNEGGLYAERVGMHLPGFPTNRGSNSFFVPVNATTTTTTTSKNTTTLQVPGATVQAFRTKVPLHVPKGLDVSISFRFASSSSEGSNRLRALLFVNGYQYGRFNPYIGNQVNFPVPPGILNYDGENVILVTVWSQGAEGAELEVGWEVDFVHESSFDMGFDAGYLRPGWGEERWDYI